MRKLLVFAVVAAFAAFAWVSLPRPDREQTPGAPLQTATGRGTVVGIDREQGVVTISHEPLRELNMMAMTMGYLVKDKTRLASLQPMQRVEFQIVYDGINYVITEIK
ncbi:MAG: copper-binding protein [Betaproteobacteria bacterium]|nr:copper-binding protein [Betaproteobacteria bacterium]